MVKFRQRRWAAMAVGAVMVAMVSGCTGPTDASPSTHEPDGGPAAEIAEFVGDWEAGRSQDASRLTDQPGAAALLLAGVPQALHATDLDIAAGPVTLVDDDKAAVTATITWRTPTIGEWTYEAPWTWSRHRSVAGDGTTASRWLLDFAPTVVHPDLGPSQTLAVRVEPAVDGPIVDRNDTQLISPVRVYSVVLLVDKVPDVAAAADALAVLLSPLDDTITVDGIVAGVRTARQAGDNSYTVLNLREGDFTPIEAKLTAIAGVTLPSEVRDVPPTAGFAPTVLATALPIATEMTAGAPGWRVVIVDMAGDELATIAEHPAEPGPKVTFTLDPAAQDAAQAAVDPLTEPTVLVALEPGTGEILAVAQNAAANAEGPISLMGRYPPGSIFKIVTATAAMDAGLITPTTTVACPGSWSADHKTIRNEGFALGSVTATAAFANSCNTTFAALSAQMDDAALPVAALQYGIGLDFDITGITTLTGAIQNAPTVLARAQNGFGQGTDLVTPFGAALMAVTAAGGNMPTPTLIRGSDTAVDRPAPTRSAEVKSGVRAMMRAVVTDGTAKALRDVGEVHAKTGTAEYVGADGEIHAHAWTVGFRDDVAFAVLIVGGDSSKRSNDIAHTFLAALP